MSTRVLVVGATGNQGGAVVDGLLAMDDDQFSVSGLTRDATSEKAQALENRGITVVEGDLNDTESLRDAMDDVDAVFAVTNYFIAGFEGEIEAELGNPNVKQLATEVSRERLIETLSPYVADPERVAGSVKEEASIWSEQLYT